MLQLNHFLRKNIFKTFLIIIVFCIFFNIKLGSTQAAALSECKGTPRNYPVEQIKINYQRDIIDSGKYKCQVNTSVYAPFASVYTSGKRVILNNPQTSFGIANVYVKYIPKNSSLFTKNSGMKYATCGGSDCGKFTDKDIPSGTTSYLFTGTISYQKLGSQDACYVCANNNYCDALRKGKYNQELQNAFNSSYQSFITKKVWSIQCKPNYPPPVSPSPSLNPTSPKPTTSVTTSPKPTPSAVVTSGKPPTSPTPPTTTAGTSPTVTTPTTSSATTSSVTTPSEYKSGDSFTKISAPDIKDYGPGDWSTISLNIFNLLAKIIGISLVIMILIGAIMFITSAGNDEQAGKAKTLLTNVVIGAIFVALAWGIVNFIADQIQNPTTGGGTSPENSISPSGITSSPENGITDPNIVSTPTFTNASDQNNYNDCFKICQRHYEEMKQNYGCNNYLNDGDQAGFDECLIHFGVTKTYNECLDLCKQKIESGWYNK